MQSIFSYLPRSAKNKSWVFKFAFDSNLPELILGSDFDSPEEKYRAKETARKPIHKEWGVNVRIGNDLFSLMTQSQAQKWYKSNGIEIKPAIKTLSDEILITDDESQTISNLFATKATKPFIKNDTKRFWTLITDVILWLIPYNEIEQFGEETWLPTLSNAVLVPIEMDPTIKEYNLLWSLEYNDIHKTGRFIHAHKSRFYPVGYFVPKGK